MIDIRMDKTNTVWDVTFTNGDLTSTNNLDTAVLMSLYTDVRASNSEVPEIQRRRGWWGNIVSNYPDYQIGSKLWLLYQARLNQDTLNLVKTYIYNCLSWMIDDGFITGINVATEATSNEGILILITLSISQNIVYNNEFQLWLGV
jgi:phage gp46-like protein